MTAAKGLRVLLTVDAVGGVWQYGIDLAAALSERGVQTVIAVLGPQPSADQRAGVEAIAGAKLVETGLPLDWLCDGPRPVLAAGAAIMRLAREESVDLLHLNSPALAAAEPLAIPVVAVAHGCIATWWQAVNPGVPLPAQYHWHRALIGEGLRAADMVVAPSAGYARLVARHYGLPHVPVVVHNGRTVDAAERAVPLHDCAFTAGRLWDRAKNAELMDRVAARLAVPFHAAGPVSGPHGETVALEHLHLLGRLDDDALAARLAARPVFVSAAGFEPFGLAVLEAAAAGCALVLSDIPVFRELWDGAAVFVEHQDEADYAWAISSIIEDGEFRVALGNAARAHAGRYTTAAMADNMLRIYARVADPKLLTGRAA